MMHQQRKQAISESLSVPYQSKVVSDWHNAAFFIKDDQGFTEDQSISSN
jgi:hypothetical protein